MIGAAVVGAAVTGAPTSVHADIAEVAAAVARIRDTVVMPVSYTNRRRCGGRPA
jgi:hypothetical protein